MRTHARVACVANAGATDAAEMSQLPQPSMRRSFESEKGDIATFFHSDGFLAQEKYKQWVTAVLEQFGNQAQAGHLKAQ